MLNNVRSHGADRTLLFFSGKVSPEHCCNFSSIDQGSIYLFTCFCVFGISARTDVVRRGFCFLSILIIRH